MTTDKIIVPIDFTSATKNALDYALQFINGNSSEIILLHILGQNEKEEAREKLEKLISEYSDFECKISFEIIKGQVKNEIGRFSKSVDAGLIVMGTHDNSSFQKLFGTNAMQVVSECKTPFIIIQDSTVFSTIGKIVMTIDLERESIQVAKIAAKLCERYNSELVLIGGDHTDVLLKQKVKVNIKVVLSYLKDAGIKCTIELLDRKNFTDELMMFCKVNDVNMIAASYYADNFQLLSKKFVQKLLENNLKIPVLTINAEVISIGSQFSFLTV
ncbi:MAG: nucleotide-binding universal stress UspA family protein [Lentimonas sp.]|jgi:nucleotide-binding universal stress UspA family protein